MHPKVLLVNPPVYDFSAYDYWLKPFGLLRVAGTLRGRCDMHLFDYLDRWNSCERTTQKLTHDQWGRGEFPSQEIDKPAVLKQIPRRYRRFGWSRRSFQKYLADCGPFDFALIQSVMTYWYPGVQEVLEDIRTLSPGCKTILGGVYATLCPAHARGLGVDLVVEGTRLDPLWAFLDVEPKREEMPFWEGYTPLKVGILKLAQGCPFRCTYCSVPQVEPNFVGNPLDQSLRELEWLCRLGVENVAFYDDALLYRPDKVLFPFLQAVEERRIRVSFHTPNALNARFIDEEMARRLVQAGFRTFYLGFESSAYEWQKKTGAKVYSHELVRAVENLVAAGATRDAITAYLIIAHPHGDLQHVEESMRFAHDIGIRVMLSEFSPIPGTPDGEACRRWVDLEEPLWHNKTVFPLVFLGEGEVNRLKSLQRELNNQLQISLLSR